MEDLDALLADLQNTTAHLNNSVSSSPYRPPSECGSGHYGSVHSSPRSASYGTPPITMSSFSPASHSTMHTITTERYEYHHGDKGSSPIYQNQQIINEVTTTTSTPRQPVSTNLSNNLSELDTLLEDLNSARFINYADKKGSPNVNGISPPPTGRSVSPHHKPVSPVGSTGSGGDRRPSVEALLDELQSAVSATHGSPRPYHYRSDTVTMSSYPAPEVRYQQNTTAAAPSSVPTASSATKELDDLMASLSDFKLNANNLQNQAAEQDPAYAKPQKKGTIPRRDNQLDSMLGTLQSDMNKQGVNTTAKGHCAACNKPIVGQVVTALGKTWHPEHFVCAHCNLELGTKNFFERDGEPYCETDYHNIFSPRCAYCNGPILDKCVTALDKTWHPEHFFCSQCGRQFGEDGFHEKDGKPYCRDDYFELFAPKCGGCNRPITENYISALNSQWHPECFVCRDCRQPFNGGSFYDHEGQPYCETHYHAKRGV